MNYQSPIEVIHMQMQSQIEEEIYKAVMRVGVSVDKDELLKALAYDRNQYQKGYYDRDEEIVRCKECKYAKDYTHEFRTRTYMCQKTDEFQYRDGDFFCADGERKEGS